MRRMQVVMNEQARKVIGLKWTRHTAYTVMAYIAMAYIVMVGNGHATQPI